MKLRTRILCLVGIFLLGILASLVLCRKDDPDPEISGANLIRRLIEQGWTPAEIQEGKPPAGILPEHFPRPVEAGIASGSWIPSQEIAPGDSIPVVAEWFTYEDGTPFLRIKIGDDLVQIKDFAFYRPPEERIRGILGGFVLEEVSGSPDLGASLGYPLIGWRRLDLGLSIAGDCPDPWDGSVLRWGSGSAFIRWRPPLAGDRLGLEGRFGYRIGEDLGYCPGLGISLIL